MTQIMEVSAVVECDCEGCPQPGSCCQDIRIDSNERKSKRYALMTLRNDAIVMAALRSHCNFGTDGKSASEGGNRFAYWAEADEFRWHPLEGHAIGWSLNCTALDESGRCSKYTEERPHMCTAFKAGHHIPCHKTPPGAYGPLGTWAEYYAACEKRDRAVAGEQPTIDYRTEKAA